MELRPVVLTKGLLPSWKPKRNVHFYSKMEPSRLLGYDLLEGCRDGRTLCTWKIIVKRTRKITGNRYRIRFRYKHRRTLHTKLCLTFIIRVRIVVGWGYWH